jgi:hypothetical protein
MPFVFATFQQHLRAANPNYSRIINSSFSQLENYLNGRTLGPADFPRIQALYGAIPRDKQQKYSAAANYLKANVAGLADAIPSRPRMHYREFRVMFSPHGGIAKYPLRLYHVHELRWSSSNGEVSSLNTVGTRENVAHRTNPAGPPFDPAINGGIPMQFTQGATTNSGANTCSNYDDHSIGNPTLLVSRPLAAGSVIADQVYEYTTNGTNWYPIPETQFELEKGIRQSRGQMVFFFRKQNGVGNPNKFHFDRRRTSISSRAGSSSWADGILGSFLRLDVFR